jgi:ribonuclease R
VFTIDSASARALDDGISFETISPGLHKVSIHIADVASLVPPNSPLDKEALKRGASTYVLNTFHMPMLPRELNANKCSLLQDEPRLAVTLSVMMNDQGLVDFSSAQYHLTVLKNTCRLSYNSADDLIHKKDEEGKKILNNESFPKEFEDKLSAQLK